jgi:hypothetical protein
MSLGVLTVTVLDAEFLPEQRVNKNTEGFYIHLGKKLQDVLVLSDPSILRVALKNGSEGQLDD